MCVWCHGQTDFCLSLLLILLWLFEIRRPRSRLHWTLHWNLSFPILGQSHCRRARYSLNWAELNVCRLSIWISKQNSLNGVNRVRQHPTFLLRPTKQTTIATAATLIIIPNHRCSTKQHQRHIWRLRRIEARNSQPSRPKHWDRRLFDRVECHVVIVIWYVVAAEVNHPFNNYYLTIVCLRGHYSNPAEKKWKLRWWFNDDTHHRHCQTYPGSSSHSGTSRKLPGCIRCG